MATYDVICVGAGPTGLACAIEAVRAGMKPLVIDKGALCNSIFHYPVNMYFFTTPELLEIGDLPLVCAAEKPTRTEALKYYRKAAEHYGLELRLYETVLRLEGNDGNFTIVTRTEKGTDQKYSSRKVVIATGYYDLPNAIGVPGEDLPHVSHYYTEAHPFYDRDVVVIGGKNSAAEAALDLFRGGARVSLVHRGPAMGQTVKYWVRPDIDNRFKNGQVTPYFNAKVLEITKTHVRISQDGALRHIPAQQVFALTGYHCSTKFFEQVGVRYDSDTLRAEYNPETFETNVAGIYLAGSVVGGRINGEIFIENGRFHGEVLVKSIVGDR